MKAPECIFKIQEQNPSKHTRRLSKKELQHDAMQAGKWLKKNDFLVFLDWDKYTNANANTAYTSSQSMKSTSLLV